MTGSDDAGEQNIEDFAPGVRAYLRRAGACQNVIGGAAWRRKRRVASTCAWRLIVGERGMGGRDGLGA